MPVDSDSPSGPRRLHRLDFEYKYMQPTEIERIGSGGLAVMGRPRAGDWASDELAGLAHLGVTEIVSLLEPAEAHELGLAEEPAFCAVAGIRFHSFPITHRGVPASPEEFSRLACRLYHSCAFQLQYYKNCNIVRS